MRNSTFTRKIIYAVIAAILLIPLSLISQPAARPVDSAGNLQQTSRSEGGKLARLRNEYDLSQSKMMEIDPASETMKLASVGLRGVAVNMLWMQAMKHRKEKNWDKLRSTLNALVKIQPNFIKVWEYQAHNLSYNISVEFDDYEYRYHWVKEGIKFLTDGIPFNYRNHRITDNLGFFTGMKIGRSDERFEFRKLFRKDTDFHEAMLLADGRGVAPDLYDTREYGHDNWKMSYQWYDKSRDLVAKYPKQQYINDMMFYRKRPMQLMNQARSLQQEFPSDDIIREIWREGNREWNEYGEQEIRTSSGLPITFKGLAERESRLQDARTRLDDLVPGYRQGYMNEIYETAKLSDAERLALETPADERDEEMSLVAAGTEKRIQRFSRNVDARIAENAGPEDLAAARRIAGEISNLMSEMHFADSYSETVNWKYWDIRSQYESQDITGEARRAMRRATEMKRSSVFDDEYRFDPQTGKKKLIKKGAISLFDDAFQKWKNVLDNSDAQKGVLVEGEIIEDLMDACGEYYDMIRITGRQWPENFVFQDFIDARSIYGEEELPTSQDVRERISGETDEDEVQEESDSSAPGSDESDADESANGRVLQSDETTLDTKNVEKSGNDTTVQGAGNDATESADQDGGK